MFLLAINNVFLVTSLIPLIAGFSIRPNIKSYPVRDFQLFSGLLIAPNEISIGPMTTFAIGMPRVLPPTKDDVEIWQMWFHGRDETFSKDLVSLCTGNVYYATSTDGVSDWKVHPDSPVLQPSDLEGNWWWFDSTHVGLGDIFIPGQEAQAKFRIQGGVYMMYIFGGNKDNVELNEKSIKGTKMEIGVAVSQDGAHWSRVEGSSPHGAILEAGGINDFDGQFVGWPSVLSIGSETRMYYNTYCPRLKKFVVGVATSRDGIKFKKVGPVFDGGPTGKFDALGASRRHVLRLNNGQYRMWYEGVSLDGKHSIGLATSPDGFNWERVSDEPIFGPNSDSEAWDAGGVGSPHLVWLPEKKRWRMYYMGTPMVAEDSLLRVGPDDSRNIKSAIGIAESLDEDGLYFERLNTLKL